VEEAVWRGEKWGMQEGEGKIEKLEGAEREGEELDGGLGCGKDRKEGRTQERGGMSETAGKNGGAKE